MKKAYSLDIYNLDGILYEGAQKVQFKMLELSIQYDIYVVVHTISRVHNRSLTSPICGHGIGTCNSFFEYCSYN